MTENTEAVEIEETDGTEEVVEEALNETEQKILSAFKEAIGAEKDDDDIKLAMIQAGAKFSNVTRYFNKFSVDEGLVISKEDKAELVSDAVSENDVSDADGFKAAVKYVAENGTGLTEKQAASAIRTYCKKNEVEIYKAPRGGGQRKHIIDDVVNLLVDNPMLTKEEMTKFIEENGNKTAKTWEHFYQKIRVGFNRVAEANS